jgi:hypothetical protein
MSPRPLLPLLLCLLLAGCVIGDRPDDTAMTAPTFSPEGEAVAETPGAADAAAAAEPDPEPGPDPDAVDERSTDSGDVESPRAEVTEDPSPTSASPVDGGPSAQGGDEPRPADAPQPPPLRSRITDPRGDTESLRLGSPPRHADLVGGTLVRDDRGYRLTIEFDGGVPEQARDGDHTMNVASFFDITGDGHVDVEVWANLADGGWDSARYDNRSGAAAFSDEDDVTVSVIGDGLVLGFPLEILDGAERFRWAVASEWGRYDQLGTPMSVRDEMPDGGAPAPFPG